MWPLIYILCWNGVSISITNNKGDKNYLVPIEMVRHMISTTIRERILRPVLDSKAKIRKIIFRSLQETKHMTGGVSKDYIQPQFQLLKSDLKQKPNPILWVSLRSLLPSTSIETLWFPCSMKMRLSESLPSSGFVLRPFPSSSSSLHIFSFPFITWKQ